MSDHSFDEYDLSEFTEHDFAAIDAALARAHGGPAVQIVIEDSPFRKFRKKHLAVTDIVSPLWCEVQYEYGLYGQRNRPLPFRPSKFTSKSGKQIHVHKQVAHTNEQRLKRGRSVHKALEDELSPEKVVVRAATEEERFGLRLLRLIDGFNQLVFDGITRELPVFAITHAQVVLGVIFVPKDEVIRLPLTLPDQDQDASPSSSGSITGSPPKKRQRHSSPPTQQLTPPPLELPTVTEAEPTNPGDLYELRIIDYKTRRSPTVPLDEDSLSPRLQLMMYHRMLSSVLEPEAFDFDLLWNQLNLDPTRPFSPKFLKDILWEQRQTGPTDSHVDLNRLVSEWISTVQGKRAGLIGISQHLQIVYRRSVFAGKHREKGKSKATETIDMDDPLQALALQEELDIAHAIEESLGEAGFQDANQVAQHVAQSVKQAGPSSVGRTSAVWKDLVSPSDSAPTDPTLAWAIQESLLNCARKAQAQVSVTNTAHGEPPNDETKPPAIAPNEQTTLDISPIIGTKEFEMNDEKLDSHIADVLQWWFGARPARGVDIDQTNRCFTCEYRDSCEWREQKAREAALLAPSERNTPDGV